MQPVDRNESREAHAGRVLLVENDLTARADYIRNLEKWGFNVVIAEGESLALQEDARQKAKKQRCHIAVVDMRLRDDDDPEDHSGLELVPTLTPTGSIIISAFGDRQTAVDALKDKGAWNFVGKEEGPGRLREAMQNAICSHWPCLAKDVAVHWPYALPGSKYLIRRFFPDDSPDGSNVPVDEVDNLLRQLYPDAASLTVNALDGGERSPSLSVRPRSIVVTVKVDNKPRPDIVKISRTDRPVDEFGNYHNHVEDRFPLLHYARLKNHFELWDVRGAVYDHVGNWGDMKLFRDYYRQQPAEDIRAVIQQFGEAWKEQYSNTRSPEPNESLFKVYSDVWGLNWCERLKDMPNLLPHTACDFQDLFEAQGLPDPVDWVRKRVGLGSGKPDDHSPIAEWKAVLHGDLQGDNCFVDVKRKDLWVIDFERSRDGPILEDWVELENDVLTRLMHLDTRRCLRFVSLSKEITSLKGFWSAPDKKAPSDEIGKALQIVREIRQQALATTGQGDERYYLWGLLLNVVFRLTLWREDIEGKKTEGELPILERCLLLGGMICRSLETLGDTRKQWEPPLALELFCSYAHEDKELIDRLEKHLANLHRQGVISAWHYRKITGGTEWKGSIDAHLNSADIVLLLVSADFVSSDYCYDVEMQLALQRHDAGQARVIPVILRPVDWEGAPFDKLEALPRDAKPITSWSNREAAFTDVAEGIRRAAEEILASRS